MGLDSVEIVIEVEDAFDIAIDDDDAGQVLTVGNLHDLVVSKLPEREQEVCHSAHVFYRLRRYLTDHLRWTRRDVRRKAETAPLLLQNTDDIRHGWQAAEREVWQAVQGIVMVQIGAKAERVTPEAHFIRDLGIG